jgi:methionyl aminopeptidase
VVRLTLDALEEHVRPGITTGELDRIAAGVLAGHGARSAPMLVYGFPGSALISINDEVVHGVPGDRPLARGDVVKLDVTAEKNGYMADAARTVIVEAGSEVARRLRLCVRQAFERALRVARAGRRVSEVGRVIEREVRGYGFSVVRGLDGHGIGRTIHEPPNVPNSFDPRQTDVLTEGLVITIEPIICAGSGRAVETSDGWTIRTADGSLAAHHEHTLVITRGEPMLLTAA